MPVRTLVSFMLMFILLQGVITEDVVQLRKSIGAPGMAVLQFGNIARAALSVYFPCC